MLKFSVYFILIPNKNTRSTCQHDRDQKSIMMSK